VQRASLNSLLRNAEQGGGVPRWPLATWEGGFMVGAPGHVIAAESVLKGLGGWEDAALIQQAVDEALGRVRPPYSARPDPDGYPERGYLSEEISGTSVAWTQELCLADHGLARAARALGLDPADADELERRSGFWANLYNPETGFFQARTPDGAWIPLRSESAWDDPFSEGNARQYLWMVPHDPEGLMQTLGPTALDRLTEFFDEAALDAGDDIRGVPEEWYWHGNEIDLHAPWLFSYLGRPDLTRRWVRWVMDTWYKPTPDGLAGNDDGGTLSAWYVWAALGLYPMAGTDVYVVGWPAFDRIELDRPGGGPLVITRSGDGLADGAEVELRIDGEPAPGLTLDHATLAAAAALEFRAR
jgi:predicted alpha-1,2-mannosidase